MEQSENTPPPFWLQSSSATRPQPHRRLNRASSFLINSSAFLIVLLVVALCFILIVIPKFLNFTSQLLRPQSVKKSWDSLNLILILFAIVCGFLGRNTNDDKGSFEDRSGSLKRAMKSTPSTPRQWYQYSDDRDRTADNTRSHSRGTVHRMRSSSSYPDLRLEETLWSAGDERWRFHDDTYVAEHRFVSSDQLHRRREARSEIENEDLVDKSNDFNRSEIREEVVDSRRRRSPSPPPTPPPPAVKTPKPKVVKRKPKRTLQELDHRNRNVNSEGEEFHRIQLPPLSPPSFYQEPENKSGKNEKKRSGAGATKEFLTSLRRKKKKQRQKSIESFETIINSQPPPPSPPPPPPLPPPSVFHNLFSSKKGKNKISQSVPPIKPEQETETLTHLSKPHEIPSEISRINSLNDEDYVGGASPFHPIPPPPPPPNFKMSSWKFVAHGDFISINSNSSSPRAGSPEIDESEADAPPDIGETKPLTGGLANMKDTASPMFCSSPDVNSKADKFIERFRADLKLQKMNSMKARKRSNLGR